MWLLNWIEKALTVSVGMENTGSTIAIRVPQLEQMASVGAPVTS
jgi:hypothetical protein